MRNSLKNNYEIIAGTVLEDFSDKTEFTWSIGAGGSVEDTPEGIKVTSVNAGVVYGTKVISWDLSNMGRMVLDIDVADLAEYVTTTIIYIGSTSNVSVNHNYSIPSGELTIGRNTSGSRRIVITKDMFSAAGGEVWGTTKIALRVRVLSGAGKTNSVTFKKLTQDLYQKPKIIITFDDIILTDYTEAFSYMNPLGLVGTSFAPSIYIGADGRLSVAQMQEMYNAGWDFGNHSYNHVDLTKLTLAEATEELTSNSEDLVARGFTRGAYYLAWPFGAINNTTIQAAQDAGILAARTSNDYIQDNGAGMRLTINRITCSNTKTLSDYTTAIDNLCKRGMAGFLNFHELITPATESTQVTPTMFQDIMDYIKAKQDEGILEVVTISEWYNGLQGVRRSVTR